MLNQLLWSEGAKWVTDTELKPDTVYNRTINKAIENALYGNDSYISGLHTVNPDIPHTINRDCAVPAKARTPDRVKRTSDYQVSIKASGKTHAVTDKLITMNNPEENALTAYYIKEQKFASRPKNQHYSDLLSMSLSDMVIEMLEKKQDCNDMAIINNTRSDATTNLSRQWTAKKRPADKNRAFNVYDDDGNSVDVLDFVSVNNSPNNNFIKQSHKLLSLEQVKVFDLMLSGHTAEEIAMQIEKTDRTVKRMIKSIKTTLKPAACDLADYVALKNNLPVYALADSNRVWADNVYLSDKLPSKVKHIPV